MKVFPRKKSKRKWRKLKKEGKINFLFKVKVDNKIKIFFQILE